MRIIVYLTLSCLCYSTSAYRPVVLIHGLTGDRSSYFSLKDKIQKEHPGTEVFIPNQYPGFSGYTVMQRQVESFGKEVMNISNQYPDGINLIGYSQGGLIARGILENFPTHNVKSFISLSSPHGGVLNPRILQGYRNIIKEHGYIFFYFIPGQTFSVANYWRDPDHPYYYLRYCNFLPKLNNEIWTLDSLKYKSGMIKLENFVLIGGPDDEIIGPWQSSQFGYLDNNHNIVLLNDQETYHNDALGLKTLNESNRLHIFTVSGITHDMWPENDEVFYNYVLPFLN